LSVAISLVDLFICCHWKPPDRKHVMIIIIIIHL